MEVDDPFASQSFTSSTGVRGEDMERRREEFKEDSFNKDELVYDSRRGIPLYGVALAFLLLILLILLIVMVVYYSNWNTESKCSQRLQPYIMTPCDRSSTIYTLPFQPFTSRDYDKANSASLLQMSLNITRANCTGWTLTQPPLGFDGLIAIHAIDPTNSKHELTPAYVFYSEEMRTTVIAFTGYLGLSQWNSEYEYRQVAPVKLNGYKKGMRVHKLLYQIYEEIQGRLWRVWNALRSQTETLVITGYSVGGGLANLAGLDFSQATTLQDDPVYVYSHAAMRVGNNVFARTFNDSLIQPYRVYNEADGMTNLPPSTINGYYYLQSGVPVSFGLNLATPLYNHLQAYERVIVQEAQNIRVYVGHDVNVVL